MWDNEGVDSESETRVDALKDLSLADSRSFKGRKDRSKEWVPVNRQHGLEV